MKLHPFAKMLWGASVISRADKIKALGGEPKDKDWRPFIFDTAKRVFEKWKRELTEA